MRFLLRCNFSRHEITAMRKEKERAAWCTCTQPAALGHHDLSPTYNHHISVTKAWADSQLTF